MDKHFTRTDKLNSSWQSQAWYDEETGELYIDLKSGQRIGYTGVSPVLYQGYRNAPSAGKFWQQYIKNRLTGIDGNVDLYERPKKKVHTVLRAVDSPTATFKVEYELVGTAEIEAADIAGALDKFSKVELPEGTTVVIRGVNRV